MRMSFRLASAVLWLTVTSPIVTATPAEPHLQVQFDHSAAVLSVALTPDERFVLSGSQDGTLKIWDASRGLLIRTLEGQH